MYESGTRLAAEVATDVRDFFEQRAAQGDHWAEATTFATHIRRNIRLAEAPSFGQSIFQYAEQSHGADDYRQLCREVLGQASIALASRDAA
jgi:chromosome partitioning protein